jgi:hypothetical protein
VVVDQGPLAELLRDAENISHTEWQKNSANFQGKYRHGPSVIDLVVNSAARLQNWLTDDSGKEDPALLLDLFSLPVVEEEVSPITPTRKPSRKKGGMSGGKQLPARKRPQFIISRVADGFSVRVDPDFPQPERVRIQVAYDVSKGSPVKKWREHDFVLMERGIIPDPPLNDGELLSNGGNNLVYRVTGSDFVVGMKGFDENRDLYVKVNAEREQRDDT